MWPLPEISRGQYLDLSGLQHELPIYKAIYKGYKL